MTASRSKITDSISVTMNDDLVVESHPADMKGPDPDRLANHAAEVKAHAARLRKEIGTGK